MKKLWVWGYRDGMLMREGFVTLVRTPYIEPGLNQAITNMLSLVDMELCWSQTESELPKDVEWKEV